MSRKAGCAAADAPEPVSGAAGFSAVMKSTETKSKRAGRDKRADPKGLSQATATEFEREGMGVAPKE